MHGFNGTVRMFPFHDCTALPCQLGKLYETICLIGICRLNFSAVHPHWTPTFPVPLVPVHQNNIFSDQRHITCLADPEWTWVQPIQMVESSYGRNCATKSECASAIDRQMPRNGLSREYADKTRTRWSYYSLGT
jgi:hypothetical protein